MRTKSLTVTFTVIVPEQDTKIHTTLYKGLYGLLKQWIGSRALGISQPVIQSQTVWEGAVK